MIRIEICPAYGGMAGYYRATGHAGPGNERICTAVSAIEECLAANLGGVWNVKLRRTVNDGRYALSWNKSDHKGAGLQRANQAAGFAYNGLKALAKTYPDVLEVKWKQPDYDWRAKP